MDRRWIDDGTLPAMRTPGGHRVILGSDLASFATNVAIHPSFPTIAATSARNRFIGLITNVKKDGVSAHVELISGSQLITSLMSRASADELGLEPGVMVVASIKPTSVVIELPTFHTR